MGQTPAPLSRIEKGLGAIAGAFAVAGGLALLVLVVVTGVSVFYRYVLRAPIFGIEDISTMTLTVIVAASVAWAATHRGHVSVNVLSLVAGRNVTRITDLIARLVSFGILAFACYALFVKGACGMPCGAMTSNLGIIHTPFYYALGTAMGFLCGSCPDPTAYRPCPLERHRSQRGDELMDRETIAATGFAALFLLLLIRVPVGLAMLISGAIGIYLIRPPATLPVVAGEIFGEAANYPLTILPLFILMGNLAGISGMSRDLYDAAHGWFGHLKGGLASATIVGCAGFSALSGSSLAAALTMGRVSLPEMKRYNYHDGLATGAVAAGGTLGILIPPSAGFVVYAILTEESIGRLFMAGILPGLLLTVMFIVAIWIVVTLSPAKAPVATNPEPLKTRVARLGRAGWIIGIIVITIGGIYAGVFSAIEAAGVGGHFGPGSDGSETRPDLDKTFAT